MMRGGHEGCLLVGGSINGRGVDGHADGGRCRHLAELGHDGLDLRDAEPDLSH
jgi:hypothetical protein